MNADAARRDRPHPPPARAAHPPSRPSKKRVRNFTADDRAAHREFEKGRRKAFRERLTELASHVPALANVEPQKLSKHVVVEESIARHEQLEASCADALGMIQALAKEREELLAEVNTWRAGAGLPLHERTTDASTGRLVNVDSDAQHLSRMPYAGSSTPEPHVDYQPLHMPNNAHYSQEVAPATTIPDNDLVTMALEAPWSLMEADGAPLLQGSDGFADASHLHRGASLPRELGML